jgi:uncharacterized RDD family membrane protein YckC
VNDEQLHITGLTGVELNLTVAGPGSRSYAFITDWFIRLLLSLAWMLGVVLVLRTRNIRAIVPLIVWPALAIYLLYHPVLEILMQGRTPGKRTAGVRLVTRRGGLPSVSAILIRNVFRLLDSAPAFYMIGLTTCMFTRDRVRVGDLASGTVLVLENARAARVLEIVPELATHTGLDPRLLELIQDLLDRWPSLSSQRRVALARALLARTIPTTTPAQEVDALATLSESELHQRLRTVLTGAA